MSADRIRKNYADAAFGQVHYAHQGEGPPLVLLGPAPRSWRAFEHVFPLLKDSFHLVAPDPPCFGESAAVSADATMRDVAAAVVSVLDDLRIERAHVYGHNTGRLIAAALAADWPERVDRLIVAGPTFTLIPEQDVRIAAVKSFVGDRYFDEDAGMQASSSTHPAIKAWATTFRTMIGPWWWNEALFAGPDPVPVIEALENRIVDELMSRRTVGAMYQLNFSFDFAAALARTTARTLIIEITGGSADAGGFERQATRLAARMKSAETLTLVQREGPIGLFLLTGVEPMVHAIRTFLEAE